MPRFGLLHSKNVKNRPNLKIPVSKLDITIEILVLTGLVAMAILVLSNWGRLPQLVPTHFGLSGEADAWGSKNSILILPLLSVIIYGLLTVFSRLPRLMNYPVVITEENAKREYILGKLFLNVLKLVMVWLFYFISSATIRVALGLQSQLGGLLMAFLIIILLVTVIYFVLSFKFAKKKA